MSKRQINFLIASPPYTHIFAGVRVLHDLCHELNLLGHNAALIFFHSGNGLEKPYQWALSNRPDLYSTGNKRLYLPLDNPIKSINDFLENGVMIYPEIIAGNPIGAKRVVRYLLNKDDKPYPGEFVCSFMKFYRNNPDHILFKITSPDFMNSEKTNHWSNRKMDVTYFGKGPKFVDCKLIPDTVLIERDWPRDQMQLAIMLKNTRYLFSYDGNSALTTDAMLCGAVPIILHDKQLSYSDLMAGELKHPSVILSNIKDKNSLKFDKDKLDEEMNDLKASIDYWRSSWNHRVNSFVNSCLNHFSL
jgi:hypothetical protein